MRLVCHVRRLLTPVLITLATACQSAAERPCLTCEADATALGQGINIGLTFDQDDVKRRNADGRETIAHGKYFDVLFRDTVFRTTLETDQWQHLRIPVRWLAVGNTEPTDDLVQALRLIVRDLIDRGMIVVIDVHYFPYQTADGPVTQSDIDQLTALWSRIAADFSDFDSALYFELINEPKARIETDGGWAKVYTDLVTQIRETGGHNASRPIILSAPHDGDGEYLERLPTWKDLGRDPHVMAAWHTYDPFEVAAALQKCTKTDPECEAKCLAYAQNACPWDSNRGTDQWRNWQDNTSERIARQLTKSEALQLPLVIGEFGFEDQQRYEKTTPLTEEQKAYLRCERLAWISNLISHANTNGLSWTYWNAFGNYGLYNEDSDEVQPGVIARMQGTDTEFLQVPACPWN